MSLNTHCTIPIFSIAGLLLLAGCQSIPKDQAYTTFQSQPPGAMLYQGNTAWGAAPQTMIYTLRPGATEIVSAPVTAVWASGATVTTRIRMTPGIEQSYTFSRPPGAPGLDKDLAIAAQIQQNAIAQQQADAASTVATLAAQKAAQPQPPASTPPILTSCTAISNTVNCISH